MWVSWGLRVVLFAVLSAASLFADVTGTIFGVVRDKSQAVVAGAKVTATNVETNLSQDAASAPNGEYRLLALPAGTYKITASASGFQEFVTTGIDLKVNDRYKVDI